MCLGRVGRCLITFYLPNEASLVLSEGKASLNFQHAMPNYRTTHLEIPKRPSPIRKPSSGTYTGNAASISGNRCATACGAVERTA